MYTRTGTALLLQSMRSYYTYISLDALADNSESSRPSAIISRFDSPRIKSTLFYSPLIELKGENIYTYRAGNMHSNHRATLLASFSQDLCLISSTSESPIRHGMRAKREFEHRSDFFLQIARIVSKKHPIFANIFS